VQYRTNSIHSFLSRSRYIQGNNILVSKIHKGGKCLFTQPVVVVFVMIFSDLEIIAK
jgi:hypothetical protein